MMLAARLVALASGFVVLGVLGRTLSREDFGFWLVLSSLLSFAMILDFGLGQAMRNELAVLASGQDTRDRAELLFLSVLLTLGAVALTAALLLLTAFLLLPADMLPAGEAAVGALGSVTLLILLIPLNLNLVGFLAYGEVGLRSRFEVLQSVLLLVVVLALAHRLSVGGLALVYYGALDVIALAALLAFVRRRRWPWVRPTITGVLSVLRSLVRTGLRFWVLAIAAVVVSASAPLIAARTLGLAEAGDFSAIQRLFALLIAVHLTALTPLWSAYTAADHLGDGAWVRTSFRRSLLLTGAVLIIASIGLGIFARPFLILWLGRDIYQPVTILALLAWAVVVTITNCCSVLLNGLGRLRRQALLLGLGAMVHWPLSLWLGAALGGPGIVLGMILSVLPAMVGSALEVRAVLMTTGADG